LVSFVTVIYIVVLPVLSLVISFVSVAYTLVDNFSINFGLKNPKYEIDQ